MNNRKMKGNCEPLTLPKALLWKAGQDPYPWRGNYCFQATPTPSCPATGASSRVTASEIRMDKGHLWGKKNMVYFKNELKIISISRARLNRYFLFLHRQQPNTLRRINRADE